MISDLQKEQIAIQVIRTLFSQFQKFPEDVANNRNAPFHEAFLQAFSQKLDGKVHSIPIFLSLSSWIHGLNTSLGQSFFERTAHILCNGEKTEFKNNKIFENQKNMVSEIITGLQNNSFSPNLVEETKTISKLAYGNLVNANDFTVDVFWEDIDKVIAIEAKTVRPNSDISKQTKTKILEGKIVLQNLFPNKKIYFFYGFPFDPYSSHPTQSDKNEFMRKNVNFSKIFDVDEVLLASEFWDFLSGTVSTMETILEIINSIAKVDFVENINFLKDKRNIGISKENYIGKLANWFLFREIQIVERFGNLFPVNPENKHLVRLFNQDVFNSSGEYNEKRVSKIIQ
jgi:hypothetical protein